MDTKERKFIVKIAKLYYLEGWTQSQIAKKVGLSRPIISKALKQAKEKDIVEIYIKDEAAHTVELEMQLEKRYGLKEVLVIAGKNGSREKTQSQLGNVAANYLAKRLDEVRTVGISWGKSMEAMVEAFPNMEKPHIHIVPLIGGMGQSHVNYHSNHLTFELAQKLNTRSSYLYAPAVAETTEFKKEIIASKDVAEVLEVGKRVDIAVVGVGHPVIQTTMKELGYLSEEDIQTLQETEAVGDINSNFYNAAGELIHHSLNDRQIGLSLEDIKKIPEVITIVQGAHKVESVRVALEAGILTTLVMDDQTAELLLESSSLN
ncbi:Deoxyribonucleoside regulator [Oceanobacillus picturae]|uniref:Deoxyribonucleoside regulator n=1 Tax=Oceanobacillus picturae TaxID=171693 RepID=W9BAQ4_9BACI|nr:sugar-binding transcriptional regulator [Oceanobacillus picturae]CDO03535.1 Deoxyribonucleoside regulator [Oceanobacillus picturae]